MTEEIPTYKAGNAEDVKNVVVRFFGLRWLDLLVYLCQDMKHGRIEIIIQDGHVQKIGATRWYK